MIKKIISILMVIMTVLSMVMSFSGCSTRQSNSLTVGQWLMLVDEAFGMQSYTTDEPYFDNISKGNPYFDAVQIAAEWDVIDKNKKIDVDSALKWKDALISLVNVGSFTELDASEDEKIEFAIANFDNTIRTYWMGRIISPEKAVSLLSIAQNKWANKEFDHIIEEVKYKDDVIDLTAGENAIKDYRVDNNIVQIPKNSNLDLKAGDVYVLPQNDSNPFAQVNKIESITTDENYIYIVNTDEELTLEDVAQDITIEETFVPTAENAVIYDGNGQVISVGSNVVPQSNPYANDFVVESTVAKSAANYQIMPLYSAQAPKQKHTFTVGDKNTVGEWKINLEYKLNGALDFGVEVETPNLLTKKYLNEHPSQELTVSAAAKINNLKVTNDVDYKLFKLKSATLKVDYEQELSGKLKFSGKPVNKLLAPEYQNYGSFAKNWANKVWKDADGENCKGAKTIKLASVDVYTVGVARVCLDINFTVSAEGSVSVTVTMRGAKGIEYKNGKMRLINTCDKDIDADIKAKIEATLGVGPALYVVGLKKPIIGLQVSGGFGASFNVKFNIADTENHLIESTDANQFSLQFTDDIKNTEIESSAEEIKKVAEAQGCTYSIETSDKLKLHFDVCVEGSVYGIVKVSITDTSYIAKLLGNKITTSWEVFGEKNGKLLTIHNDNGVFSIGYPGHPAECTLKYVPFEEKADEKKEEAAESKENEDDAILKGDSIILNQMYADVKCGNNFYVQIVQIPKGYKLSDLVCSSSNENVAKVNNDGVISAVDVGSTVITVSTKDKKYSAFIAITVTDEYGKTFEPLNFTKEVNYKGVAV